jgi:hypothetical protein
VDTIRENAPNHTILLSGPQWSNPGQLHFFDPATIDDTNVIYNMHFYEPFYFTHQGADWVGSQEIEDMRHVPYPSTPERISAILDDQSNPASRPLLVQYGNERWGPDKLAQVLDAGIDWARANDVAVMVTEFGVLRTWSDPIDRARWYRDVRLHLESEGVPWMIWSDLNGFGFDFETGSYETRILIALGLLSGSVEKPAIAATRTVVPGERLAVTLSGFTPGTRLNLTLGGQPIGTTITTRNDGTAATSLRIPNVIGGSRALKAFATDGLKASLTLLIGPVIRLDSATAKTGENVRVRLYGYGKNQAVTISIRQGTSQLRLIRVLVDATGTRGVTVTIPRSLKTGSASILARSSDSLKTVGFTVTGIGQSEEPTSTPTLTATVTATLTQTVTATTIPTDIASPVAPSPTESVPVASPVAA